MHASGLKSNSAYSGDAALSAPCPTVSHISPAGGTAEMRAGSALVSPVSPVSPKLKSTELQSEEGTAGQIGATHVRRDRWDKHNEYGRLCETTGRDTGGTAETRIVAATLHLNGERTPTRVSPIPPVTPLRRRRTKTNIDTRSLHAASISTIPPRQIQIYVNDVRRCSPATMHRTDSTTFIPLQTLCVPKIPSRKPSPHEAFYWAVAKRE
jgi:hypothetical protein